MNKIVHYIGLDVHKDSIAVAIAPQNSIEVRRYGIIGGTLQAVDNLLKKLSKAEVELRFVYEAGHWIQIRKCKRPYRFEKRMRMQALEQHRGAWPQVIPPLARRFSLRIRCARPEHTFGQITKNQTTKTQLSSGLMSWQRAARFRPTLVSVKRPVLGPSSLERGSAATRTVVRSISLVCRPDELTHISRINRR